MYSDDRPIIACSTGTKENTAISLIRLSGVKLNDVRPYFNRDINKFKPRTAYLVSLERLDEVVFTYFSPEKSYTGELVIELGVHGNKLNVERILDFFCKKKVCRLAKPGEFSFRALKNKKMTLSQVEGLDLLLNATSTLMLDSGLKALHGELHHEYLALYNHFLKLKSALEMKIDFSDDIGEEASAQLFSSGLSSFASLVTGLYSRTKSTNQSDLLMPTIALFGVPNAGKSTLFNLLLGHSRSIVSDVPGTTRDYVSEALILEGTNFKLVDTAGIRDLTDDAIEKEGIKRSLSFLDKSFYKILLVSNPSELDYFSDHFFDLILVTHFDKNTHFHWEKPKFTNHFFAVNLLGPIEPVSHFGPIEPDFFTGPIEPVLHHLIISKYEKHTKDGVILIDRHRHIIGEIWERFSALKDLLAKEDDVGIISHEINLLGNKLSELIGYISPDDVLNSIFQNFCIGK